MTARIDSPIGTTAIDGTPISRADLARIAAEEAMHVQQQRNAVVVVAGCARDAADCRSLLAMLGLRDEVVSQARTQLTSAPKRPPKGRAAA